jgi:hypothetical protein
VATTGVGGFIVKREMSWLFSGLGVGTVDSGGADGEDEAVEDASDGAFAGLGGGGDDVSGDGEGGTASGGEDEVTLGAGGGLAGGGGVWGGRVTG